MEHDPLALKAFSGLYPGRSVRKALHLRYHGRFKGYNANVSATGSTITFGLARSFEEASEEIKIGVMQHLLNRLQKTDTQTLEIWLYNEFMRKLTDYSEVTEVDSRLKERFDLLNEEYFDGYMMTPNLTWGTHSLTKLGHYEFGTDTVSVSTALKEDEVLLDFVLYHEMLHKKHKFSEGKGGITRTHTKAFREDERKFRIKDIEKRLAAFVRGKKRGPHSFLRKLFSP